MNLRSQIRMPSSHPLSSFQRHCLLLFSSLLSSFLLLLSLEGITRIVFPEINHQDTQASLFHENTPGIRIGWQPNATGISFGIPVVIDRFGCRYMAAPTHPETSWLILGDSVTFGVGVETSATFVGRLQQAFPTVKIWNTAVVGYSIENYRDVLQTFLTTRHEISRVLLFYCLNDLYEPLKSLPQPTKSEKLLSFLRRNSKFYMLLKRFVTDRSQAYFFYDFQLYTSANPQFPRTLQLLDVMQDALRSRGIKFVVILLPYEYQVRKKQERYLKPQNLITSHLKASKICYIDAYGYFARASEDSRQFYLYGDGMHFSPKGHERLFRLLKERLAVP